jgi:hypothetical protein
MIYDWSGERTRRIRALRIASAVALVCLVVGIPLLMS